MSPVSFFVFLLLTSFSACAQEGGFEYSFGPRGPSNWGNLRTEWSACRVGRSQSPIDIRLSNVQAASTNKVLQPRYGASDASLTSVGPRVAVVFTGNAGTLTIEGITYKLVQYHVHFPAEHTINRFRHPLEGHLVHESSDGKVAVVAIFYQAGRRDPFIAQFEPSLASLGSHNERHLAGVDASKLKVGGKSFFKYAGSLTTPPCNEGVTWIILAGPQTLSAKQLELFKAALDGPNARPLQPLSGRIVRFYK